MRARFDLAGYVEQFGVRLMQDALSEATSAYWLRRATTFDAVGNERCAVIAQACRNAAKVAVLDGGPTPAHLDCPTCGTPTSPWSCSCGQTRLPDLAEVVA